MPKTDPILDTNVIIKQGEHNSEAYIKNNWIEEVVLIHNRSVLCLFRYKYVGIISLEDLKNPD